MVEPEFEKKKFFSTQAQIFSFEALTALPQGRSDTHSPSCWEGLLVKPSGNPTFWWESNLSVAREENHGSAWGKPALTGMKANLFSISWWRLQSGSCPYARRYPLCELLCPPYVGRTTSPDKLPEVQAWVWYTSSPPVTYPVKGDHLTYCSNQETFEGERTNQTGDEDKAATGSVTAKLKSYLSPGDTNKYINDSKSHVNHITKEYKATAIDKLLGS